MVKRLLSYMKKYRVPAILAIVCIISETFFELIIPLIMADIVDVGVATGDKPYILSQGALMIGCALISMVLGVGSAKFAAVSGQGLGAELRKAEYRKFQSSAQGRVPEVPVLFLCQYGSFQLGISDYKADR